MCLSGDVAVKCTHSRTPVGFAVMMPVLLHSKVTFVSTRKQKSQPLSPSLPGIEFQPSMCALTTSTAAA